MEVGLRGGGELDAYSIGLAEANYTINFNRERGGDLDVNHCVHWQLFGLEKQSVGTEIAQCLLAANGPVAHAEFDGTAKHRSRKTAEVGAFHGGVLLPGSPSPTLGRCLRCRDAPLQAHAG